jgi:hypothetical protein
MKCPNCGDVKERDIVWLIEDYEGNTLVGYCPHCFKRIAQKQFTIGKWLVLKRKWKWNK